MNETDWDNHQVQRQAHLRRVLNTLHEVSVLISKDPDPEIFLHNLPGVMIKPGGYHMAWILRIGQHKEVSASHFAGAPGQTDIYAAYIQQFKLPPALIPLFSKHATELIYPETSEAPGVMDTPIAIYAHPLRVKKTLIGFLLVAFNPLYASDEQHLLLFEEIALNITNALQHNRTLMKLRESEEKFRTLFERSTDAQMIMKGDVFIECNDAMVRILQAGSKEALIGLTPWEVSPLQQPDGSDSRSKGFDYINAAENGQAVRFEWLHTQLTGNDIPVEVSLTPVNVGSESFIHIAMRDISDRRKAEKELRKANQLFQIIMTNTPDMIWIRDLNLKLTYINNAVMRIKGYTPEETMQRKLSENATEQSYRDYLQALSEEMETERNPDADKSRVRRFESDEICKDGSIIHTETMASFIRDEEGRAIGILGITRDISDQQKIFLELENAREKAVESDRLKSAFLANMSHEIRTPMNSILGFAELLGDKDLDKEERQQYTSIIQSGTNQLLSIISDIIDISKIQAGQVVLHREPVDIDQLFEEIRIKFRLDLVRHGKENVKLVRNCACHKMNDAVPVDRDRLNQIMGNLLSNAIKFTDSGTIELGCRLEGNFIRFHVKDTGKGIAPAYQSIIFERFRQVEETLTRTYTGTGLGLAICKGLVNLMGGTIGVISEPGVGSEFWFTIPLQE
jgi:PAS domain S-box-containing protein